MSRAVYLPGVEPDEIDVFEATQYFSGGFIFHDDLCLGKDTREARTHRRVVVGRRSLDTLIKTTSADKNYGKDKKKQWPGGKLVNFLASLFRQTLVYKKRSRKTELEVQPEKGSSSVMSCYISAKIRSEEGYCRKNKPSENYQKLATSDRGVVKYEEKETSSLMSIRESMARTDHKEEYSVMAKELEEDGEGSESSSDLFELESFYLQGDFSFDLPVYGSPNLHGVYRVDASNITNRAC